MRWFPSKRRESITQWQRNVPEDMNPSIYIACEKCDPYPTRNLTFLIIVQVRPHLGAIATSVAVLDKYRRYSPNSSS